MVALKEMLWLCRPPNFKPMFGYVWGCYVFCSDDADGSFAGQKRRQMHATGLESDIATVPWGCVLRLVGLSMCAPLAASWYCQDMQSCSIKGLWAMGEQSPPIVWLT